MRDPDSPDRTAGSEQPHGRPESAGSDKPATAELPAVPEVSAVASQATQEDGRAEAPHGDSAEATAAAGGETASAPGGHDTATKTLDKAQVGKDSDQGGMGKPGGRLPAWAGKAITAAGGLIAPASRAWRKIRPPRPAASAGGTETALQPRSGEAAGAALARLTAMPAILVVAWLLPGLPLLLGGSFQPVPQLLIAVPLAAALTVNGLRDVPGRWPRQGGSDRQQARAWTAWFGLLATVAIVAGLIVWQIRESAESVIVLRDAGT